MQQPEYKSLGLLGGTFNPIHYGHLMAAECARYEFNLDQVVFIPAARPPHKEKEDVLEAGHRCRMVEIAIRDNPAFQLSHLELERTGPSYTVDTIQYFMEFYPQAELYFIMGLDSLLWYDTWKDYRKLAGLCRIIVVTRPGYELDQEDPRLKNLSPALWERISYLSIPGFDISSSDIRRRVRTGQPFKYMVPPGVEQYILEHGLYLNTEE